MSDEPITVESLPKRLVSAALSLATSGIFPVFLAGALAVQMSAEFGYGPRGIGLSIASFYVLSSLSSVALGRLADRIGWQRAIRLSATGGISILLAVGTLAGSLESVVLLVGFAGMCNALLQPSINLMIAREAPMTRRGLIFGMKQAAIPLATFLGGISVPALALTVGWRWAFIGAAGFGACAVLSMPDPRSDEHPGPVPDHNEARLERPLRSMASYVLVSLFGQTGASVLGSFVVVSAVNDGMGEGTAGLLLAAASMAGIAARVFMGWRADRGLTLDMGPIAALMAAGSLGLALLAVPMAWAAVVGSFVGFVAAWGWPGLFNFLVIDRFSHAPATATSATQTGVYIGNGFGPLMFGLIAAWSFTLAWLISAGFLLIAAGIAWSASSRERRPASA